MGFWIFMLISDLIAPLTMVGFGAYFSKNAPDKINSVFGYRTKRSMKNRETWEFAHKYFGRLWKIAGIVLLPLTAAAMLFCLGKGTEHVGRFGGAVMLGQCVVLMLPIVFTESALKKKFG